MQSRKSLHKILKTIATNVYYQPPSSVQMLYPAIVYSRSGIDNRFANNDIYEQTNSYKLTIIDSNPDSEIIDKILRLRFSKFDTEYSRDGLNHIVFTLKY